MEVIFVPVLSEHFKYGDETEVAIIDHVVQQRRIRITNHPGHRILPQNLVLVLQHFVQVDFTRV